MRHAKSSWPDPELDDHERPLAERGQRDAPDMGRRLATCGLAPQLLLTSTAVRARQTAQLILPAFASAQPEVVAESRIYLASPGELLAVVAEQSDAVDSLVLIGHNPGLTTLCNMLLPDLALQNLPTAGAVSIDCAVAHWSAIDSADFSLGLLDYPKKAAPQAC